MEELRDMLANAGFQNIEITGKQNSDDVIRSWNFGEGVEKMVLSAYIRATKPAC